MKLQYNRAIFNDKNVDINHKDSANEEPIRIIENDLSDSERDTFLRMRQTLEGDDLDKKEANGKYGCKEKIKDEFSK